MDIKILGVQMIIYINGEIKKIKECLTLKGLIKTLNLDDKVMAAAINMQVIKQDKWSKHILKDTDRIELLDFVGGG